MVVSPADYAAVLEQLDRAGGPTREFRFELARKAFAHTAATTARSPPTLSTVATGPDRLQSRRPSAAIPPPADFDLRKVRDLRYGENPHQRGALW